MLVGGGLDDINVKGFINRTGEVSVIRLNADLEAVKLGADVKGSALVIDKDMEGLEGVTYLGKSISLTALATKDNPTQLYYISVNADTGLFILHQGEMGIHFNEEYFIINKDEESFYPSEKEPSKELTVGELEDILLVSLQNHDDYSEMEDDELWGVIANSAFLVTITATPTVLRNEQNQVDENIKPDLVIETAIEVYGLHPDSDSGVEQIDFEDDEDPFADEDDE